MGQSSPPTGSVALRARRNLDEVELVGTNRWDGLASVSIIRVNSIDLLDIGGGGSHIAVTSDPVFRAGVRKASGLRGHTGDKIILVSNTPVATLVGHVLGQGLVTDPRLPIGVLFKAKKSVTMQTDQELFVCTIKATHQVKGKSGVT